MKIFKDLLKIFHLEAFQNQVVAEVAEVAEGVHLTEVGKELIPAVLGGLLLLGQVRI